MKKTKNYLPKYVLLTAAILLFSITFALGLNYFKFQRSVTNLSNERFVINIAEMKKQAEQSLSLGFDISNLPIADSDLAEIKESDSLVTGVLILGSKAQTLRSSNQALDKISSELEKKVLSQANVNKKAPFFIADGDSRLVGQAIVNSYDEVVAVALLSYSSSLLTQISNNMLLQTLPVGGVAFLIAMLICTLFFYFYISRNGEPKKLTVNIVMGLALLFVSGPLTYESYSIFSKEVPKELVKWGQAFGKTEVSLIGKAVNEGGLSLSQLVGVKEHFENQLAQNSNLEGLKIVDKNNKQLFISGVDGTQSTSVSIKSQGGVEVGKVVTSLNPNLATQLISENIQDLMIVLLVILFISSEVMAMANIGKASHESSNDALRKIRAPAFLIFLAEEFTRTVMPTISQEMSNASFGYSTSLLISLPIVVFMIVVAFGQPLSSGIIAKFGRQKTLVFGVILSSCGFLTAAMASNFETLIIARVIGGISYALLFISVQDHIIQNTTKVDRAIGFALLVGTIMVATVCGPSLGGIIADNFGNRVPFGVAAILCLSSLIWLIPMANVMSVQPQNSIMTAYKALAALKTPGFSAICFLNAIPAKMILAGVCFYLVPMFVATLGKNQAFTGRLLMIYAVIMVLLVPLVAKFAITYKRQVFFMNMGAIFSGIGLIYLGLSTDIWALIICIVFIGLGQAMSISSQSSLVAQVVDEGLIRKHSESGIYGAYRFNERLGNAFGPILAATLIVSLGYQSTFLVFGVISLIATILGYIILLKNQQKLELIN